MMEKDKKPQQRLDQQLAMSREQILLAINEGNNQSLKQLLSDLLPTEKKACIDFIITEGPDKGCSPLYVAAAKGNSTATRELLLGLSSQDQITMITSAVIMEKEELLNSPHITSEATQPLSDSASEDNFAENATKTKKETNQGFSPLYIAAAKGNTSVVKALLSDLPLRTRKTILKTTLTQGADKGLNPLHIAIYNGPPSAIAELLSYFTLKERQTIIKAKINDGRFKGWNCLCLATFSDKIRNIQAVLSHFTEKEKNPLLKCQYQKDTNKVLILYI